MVDTTDGLRLYLSLLPRTLTPPRRDVSLGSSIVYHLNPHYSTFYVTTSNTTSTREMSRRVRGLYTALHPIHTFIHALIAHAYKCLVHMLIVPIPHMFAALPHYANENNLLRYV